MKLADAHLHLFAAGFQGRYGRSPAGDDEVAVYESVREHHGIDAALVVGYEGGPHYAGNNAHLAALRARYAWLSPVAYSPAPGPTVEEVRYRFDQGFVGLSAYLLDASDATAFSGWSPAVIDALNSAGAVVSLNTAPAETSTIATAIAALDGCTVLFSHLGLPGSRAWPPSTAQAARDLSALLDLARLPHVGVKVSGLYAASEPSHAYPHRSADPYVQVLLDRYGPERLFWGSDFSPSLDHVSFAQTVDLPALNGLNADEREAVYGANLRRVLSRARKAARR